MRLKAIFMAAVLTAACGSLCAQEYRILPRELLDSVANPVAAADSPVRFERTRIDAGTIGEDDAPHEYLFRWRNCGDRPVVITEVRTGCGCISAAYDKAPVLPDGEGAISLTFRPKGHPGRLMRRISVFTHEGGRPAAVLELTGDVAPSASPKYAYRHEMGPLRLKQTQVRMSGTARSVERIEVLNGGGEELRIGTDSLPDWLDVRCIPERVAPDAKADIEISFDPAKVSGRLPEGIAVLLTGLDLAPQRRTIYVRFGDGTD